MFRHQNRHRKGQEHLLIRKWCFISLFSVTGLKTDDAFVCALAVRLVQRKRGRISDLGEKTPPDSPALFTCFHFIKTVHYPLYLPLSSHSCISNQECYGDKNMKQSQSFFSVDKLLFFFLFDFLEQQEPRSTLSFEVLTLAILFSSD